MTDVASQNSAAASDSALLSDNRFCPGCKNSVVDENGGVVVAFGQSFFHVDCFKCAKCQNQVTADTNLLLLSDGSPICANCSYCCNVCKQPILDEAIMTGEDSYHAHCFKCKVCKNRIDELVFAKTSQGIYCMDCHGERVARSRRHAERREREKKERVEREKAAAGLAGNPAVGRDASKLRNEIAREPQTNGTSSSQVSPQSQARSSDTGSPAVSTTASHTSAKPLSRSDSDQTRNHTDADRTTHPSSSGRGSASTSSATGKQQPVPGRQEHNTRAASIPSPSSPGTLTTPPSISKRNSSMFMMGLPSSPTMTRPSTAPSPCSSPTDHPRSSSSPVTRIDTLAVPSDGLDAQALQKRKSFDSSMRPTNPVLRSPSSSISLSTNGASAINGLSVSDASRKDRRRSINPAMSLAFTKSLPPTAPLHIHGRESPLREYFSTEEQTSFPPPYADSASLIPPRNNTPSPVPTHSPGSSLHLLSDSQRVTAGRARSASSSTYSEHIPDHPSALSRPSLTLDRVPVRSSSLAEPFEAPRRTLATSEAAPPRYDSVGAAGSARSTPRGLAGRRPPSLNLLNGNTIRPQRSFDDRPRASPPPLRNSRSSNGDLELHSRPGSGSVPPSPSHHVDVPHGIESGTDTEAESEEAGSAGHSKHRLPTLPPKDEAERGNSRTPTLWVDTIDISHDGRPDSEWTSESPESSPVERTSIATFIAPALPPIRISMGGGDFSDLLKSMDIGGLKSPDQFVGIKGDGKLMLDLTLTPSGMTGPAPMSTPSSEITVLGSGAMYSDRVDMKHRDLSHEREDTASPSLSSSSHGHASSKGHSSLGAGRGSVDGSSESSHFSITDYSSAGSDFADTRPSLDARRTRQDRFGSNVAASRDASVNARGVARITVTAPDDAGAKMMRADTSDSIKRHLQEAVAFAAERGVVQVCLDIDFAQSVIMLLDQRREEYNELKRNIDGMKRASQQYMDGLTVAQTEYDRELKARRDAEAEVTRLRVLLSGQAVRLTAISGDTKRQEAQRQLSRELRDNLSSLEKDVSKLKAMRDMTLAEVEQLSASNSSTLVADSEESGASIGTALSMRFDNIKTQYQHELIPLTEQRETLMREIAELKASRDAFLEETTVLNARNEELAQLNAQYVRRVENTTVESAYTKQETVLRHKHGNSLDRARSPPMLSHSLSSSTLAASEESAESKFVKVSKPDNADAPGPQFRPPKFIKWGSKAPKENAAVPGTDNNKPKSRMEHIFQQVSVLRVARCDHCGDKMWGSQFRCANCNIAVHTRCIHHVNLPCSQQTSNPREEHHAPSIAPLPPSMFGRDLIEQVRADSRNERRFVPVIVEKCIDAVDGLALEYEGIYRKTGGAGQSKTITQLFERGDYQAFDLRDTERFNDICSVTSVLKTYFRSLPNPLFTHALHEEFVNATSIRDQAIKSRTFQELVKELPQEHYYTTRAMMLHLHRVRENSDKNLMHARNLGVVFGPTLMRSRDPGAEFSDMAGKALCIEYLVENAPTVFDQPPPSR